MILSDETMLRTAQSPFDHIDDGVHFLTFHKISANKENASSYNN